MLVKIDGHLDDMNGNPDDNSIIENYRGAKAGVITGSDTYSTTKYVVSNIKTTLSDNGVDEYVTLEFFVKNGSEASTLNLFLALGEYQEPAVVEGGVYGPNEDDSNKTEDKKDEEETEKIALTRGSVYLKGINVESSSTTEFDNAEKDLGKYQVLVNLAGTSTENETPDEEEESTAGLTWETGLLLFSSILLGVVVLAVLGALLYKKFAKKANSKKKTVIGKASYDRSNLYTGEDETSAEEIKTEKDKDAATDTVPGAIDSFNDDTTEAPAEEATEAPAEEVTEAPAEEVTEAPAEEVTEAPAEEVTEAPAEEATEAPAEDNKNE
jgi:hypothetical protein